ncbi:hypothetical protein CHELA40_12945 [Chelatococcus asaccharovorans]|nr:hypothetical protein CHELA40_12945 [Chelatococcus asaccharovorans]CAH1681119.1 hypothetical protein CHELA17_62674 [Chelatococcus asaccharovorans]
MHKMRPTWRSDFTGSSRRRYGITALSARYAIVYGFPGGKALSLERSVQIFVQPIAPRTRRVPVGCSQGEAMLAHGCPSRLPPAEGKPLSR